jgi:hypothetical protein
VRLLAQVGEILALFLKFYHLLVTVEYSSNDAPAASSPG